MENVSNSYFARYELDSFRKTTTTFFFFFIKKLIDFRQIDDDQQIGETST